MPDDGISRNIPPIDSSPDGESEDWRAIAKRAMKEKDPKQVTALVEQLNRALDKSRQNNGVPNPPDAAPPPSPGDSGCKNG